MRVVPRKEALARLEEYPQDLLGTFEIAIILGITRHAAAKRGTTGMLPKPKAVIACGSIWTKDAIRDYLNSSRLNRRTPSKGRYENDRQRRPTGIATSEGVDA